jgi:uncharacterized coiled-coil DUF342 family protein
MIMRSQSNRRILLVALIAGLGAMQVSRAADSNKPKSNEKAANVNKPELPGKDGNGNGNGNSGKGEKNDADLKSEFKAQADALQKKQKDLLDQLKNANAEERAKIRDQLQTIKENWKELNREYRDKLDDLRDKAGRDSANEGRAGGRPRKN